MAREYGIPPAEARAIYARETSSGRNVKNSPAGAIGHMQLMPGTARELGVNPNDPYDNIRGGVKYYAQQRKRFGDPALAAAAYNAGPGRVQRAGNRVPNISETRNYVAAFLKDIGRVKPVAARAALTEAPAASPSAPAARLTPEQWSATVEAMGPERAEAWRKRNNMAIEGMPPQTGALNGQAPMEDDDEEEVVGGLDALGSAPTAKEFADWQRRAAEQQQREAEMRRAQLQQGQDLIRQLYGGPSTSDRLWALSQAFLSPKQFGGVKGTMYNVTQALGATQKEAEQAKKQRAEALMRLQQSAQSGEIEGARNALELELSGLKARYAASKPSRPTWSEDMNQFVSPDQPVPTSRKGVIGGKPVTQYTDGSLRITNPDGSQSVYAPDGTFVRTVRKGVK